MRNNDSSVQLPKALFPYLLVLAAIFFIVWLYQYWIPGMNSTTIALTYLLIVLIAASYGGLGPGIFASVSAVLCLNYFFLPPVGTLTIQDPQNWIALGTFLLTAFVTSQLSSAARSRAVESERRREEQKRLYKLSRAIILTHDPQVATASIARSIVEIFHVEYCGVFIKRPDNSWERLSVASNPEASEPFGPSPDQLQETIQGENIHEETFRHSDMLAQYV